MKKIILLFCAIGILGYVKNVKAEDLPYPPNLGTDLSEVFTVNDALGSGNLFLDGHVLMITNNTHQRGALWSKKKLDFSKSWNFTSFVYLGNGKEKSADGMTLTFQGESPTFIGLDGGGLGAYTKKNTNAFSLEFDTYMNSDTYDNTLFLNSVVDQKSTYGMQHVSFINHSDYQKHRNTEWINKNTFSDGLSDGSWKKLEVNWDVKSKSLSYQLSNTKGVELLHSTYLDQEDYFKNKQLWWGFTGSTGDLSTINAMTFTLLPQMQTQALKISSENVEVGQEVVLDINHDSESGDWNNRDIAISWNDTGSVEYVPDSLKVDGASITPESTSGNSIILKNIGDLKEKKTSSIQLRLKTKKSSDKEVISVHSEGFNNFTEKIVRDSEVAIKINNENLSAMPVSQNESLGTDTSKLDYSKFVTNIKLGDQLLSSDQYKVDLINSYTTDTIGTKSAKIRVTLKSDTSKILELDVPVEVSWGNSIVYGSYDYVANGRTSAAFTLYTGATPTIVSSQGIGDDNRAIHSNFSNEQYYTFSWFDLSNKQIFKMDESSNGDKYIKANGNELKKDKLKEWGTAQKQVVNYGDVVRAWQTETNKNSLYENEMKKTYNDGKKSVYYEITQSGYRALHFNQLSTNKIDVPIYSTTNYLDEHLLDLINLKGYSNISVKGFSEYPDTTSSGAKKAKIIVEETLTTGKKVQFEYEVILNVGSGSLTYTVPKTLAFKEFSKSRNSQLIRRDSSSNLGILVKDNRGSNSQGGWKLTAKINNENSGITPFVVFISKNKEESYLNGAAVPIYSQEKQLNATKPLEVDISSNWNDSDGILLKVPSVNNLFSKKYSTTVTWNLVEGP